MLIAPGFGDRGILGKIIAANFARRNNIPTLGICLGMQIMAIEFARNVLGYEKADSAEMDLTTPHPVISLMEDQKDVSDKGGTMRLGNWKCELTKDSKIEKVYNSSEILERHRHRYEFNNEYYTEFVENGFMPVGKNPETELVEILEHKEHPYYIGVQFHPEYKSTVASPHPLFISFIEASLLNKQNDLLNATREKI